jgi:hypothetical protein
VRSVSRLRASSGSGTRRTYPRDQVVDHEHQPRFVTRARRASSVSQSPSGDHVHEHRGVAGRRSGSHALQASRQLGREHPVTESSLADRHRSCSTILPPDQRIVNQPDHCVRQPPCRGGDP